jgi:hypothetical protein
MPVHSAGPTGWNFQPLAYMSSLMLSKPLFDQKRYQQDNELYEIYKSSENNGASMLFAGPVSFGNPMIAFKCSQDKLLSVLQSVSNIIERRWTLPSLAGCCISSGQIVPTTAPMPTVLIGLLRHLIASKTTNVKSHDFKPATVEGANHHMGFFSAQKLNMRNAP